MGLELTVPVVTCHCTKAQPCTHQHTHMHTHPFLKQAASLSRTLLLSPHTCIVNTSREPPMSIPHFSFLLRYIFASPSLNVSHSYNLDHKTASCSMHTTPLAHQRGAGWRQQALFFPQNVDGNFPPVVSISCHANISNISHLFSISRR